MGRRAQRKECIRCTPSYRACPCSRRFEDEIFFVLPLDFLIIVWFFFFFLFFFFSVCSSNDRTVGTFSVSILTALFSNKACYHHSVYYCLKQLEMKKKASFNPLIPSFSKTKHWQTVQTQFRRRLTRRLIWVYTICTRKRVFIK